MVAVILLESSILFPTGLILSQMDNKSSQLGVILFVWANSIHILLLKGHCKNKCPVYSALVPQRMHLLGPATLYAIGYPILGLRY